MASPVTRNPTTPYGPLVETRVRIVTWNLWWRLGEWTARADSIAYTLEELRPDLVCLQEVWQERDRNQGALLAERLGMDTTRSLRNSGTDRRARVSRPILAVIQILGARPTIVGISS
jgi:endonuclease/exonuclease/phosphatase family metal-dependent hydrolase